MIRSYLFDGVPLDGFQRALRLVPSSNCVDEPVERRYADVGASCRHARQAVPLVRHRVVGLQRVQLPAQLAHAAHYVDQPCNGKMTELCRVTRGTKTGLCGRVHFPMSLQ